MLYRFVQASEGFCRYLKRRNQVATCVYVPSLAGTYKDYQWVIVYRHHVPTYRTPHQFRNLFLKRQFEANLDLPRGSVMLGYQNRAALGMYTCASVL